MSIEIPINVNMEVEESQMAFDMEVDEDINVTVIQGTDVSDTTAVEADVLEGKKFHKADGSLATGSLSLSSGGIEAVDYTLTAGYYNADGTIHSASSNREVYTSQIECSAGDNVLIMLRNETSVTLWNCVCYWNTDGTWNSRVQLYNSGNTAFDRVVEIPSGIGKFALTYRTFGTVQSEIYKIKFPS